MGFPPFCIAGAGEMFAYHELCTSRHFYGFWSRKSTEFFNSVAAALVPKDHEFKMSTVFENHESARRARQHPAHAIDATGHVDHATAQFRMSANSLRKNFCQLSEEGILHFVTDCDLLRLTPASYSYCNINMRHAAINLYALRGANSTYTSIAIDSNTFWLLLSAVEASFISCLSSPGCIK